MINNQNLKPYPWQNQLWDKLHANKQQRHHAFLLHGPAGIGKLDFTRFLSKSLLCVEENAAGACGLCASCNWFNEDSHPDFKLISPEQEDEVEGDTSNSKKTKKKIGKRCFEYWKTLNFFKSVNFDIRFFLLKASKVFARAQGYPSQEP